MKVIEVDLVVKENTLASLTTWASFYCRNIYERYGVIPKKATLEKNLKKQNKVATNLLDDDEIKLVIDRVHYRYRYFLKRKERYEQGYQKTKPSWPQISTSYIFVDDFRQYG